MPTTFTDAQRRELVRLGYAPQDILMMEIRGQGMPLGRAQQRAEYDPIQEYLPYIPRDFVPRRKPTQDEVDLYGSIHPDVYASTRSGIAVPPNSGLTPRGIDLAVGAGHNPSIFENFGKQEPSLDAQARQAHDTAIRAQKNEARAARGANSEIEPIGMQDSAAELMNFLGNEYNDLVTNAPYHYQEAKKRVGPYADLAREHIVEPLAPRLSPYADAIRDPENTRQAISLMANDTKQKAKEVYREVKPYVEPYVDKAYTAAKPTIDIYSTLADDPEATARGMAMAAADARDYTEREAPNWVAQVSSSLNRGNKFLGSLKDAWRNPEHYLAGGTYDDRLRIQQARERPAPTEMRRELVERPVAREQPASQGFSYSNNSSVTPPKPASTPQPKPIAQPVQQIRQQPQR
jgi:hypothetical protein